MSLAAVFSGEPRRPPPVKEGESAEEAEEGGSNVTVVLFVPTKEVNVAQFWDF